MYSILKKIGIIMIIIPTLLSLLRILLTPLFVFLFWQEGIQFLVAAIAVFSIAALTDLCDGYFARRYGVVTMWGAFLDPIADKILIGSTFVCFVLKGVMPWWFIVLVLGRDSVVTILRLHAIQKGHALTTTWLAKSKTVLQFGAIYTIFLFFVLNIVMPLHPVTYAMPTVIAISLYVVAGVTLYTGLNYGSAYLRLMHKTMRRNV
jgi:CDP-diacylglycerol---glycerol-3-phosphate 3-phosphatidyltransferase